MDTNVSSAADAADSIVRTCQWTVAGLVAEVPTRHGVMAVFRHDSGALTFSLARYGEWAENEIAFLRRFIPAGGVVLDVGAYIGTHSLAFAAAAGPGGRVIAFEAQPDSFALLVNNLAVNGAETVEARLGAVGAPGGSATLALPAIDIRSPRSFGSAALADAPATDPGPSVVVPAISLDQLGLERCDLVKIDAEGMESAVLEGAIGLLGKTQPIVYAECNSVDAGARTIAWLREAGMAVHLHIVDAFNPDNWRGCSQDGFQGAREVALVGVPGARRPLLAHFRPRAVERFLPVETLDDLVVGMMLKPQYAAEVLHRTPAFREVAGA